MYSYFRSNVIKNNTNSLLNVWSLSIIRSYLVISSSKLNYLIQSINALKMKNINSNTYYFYDFGIFYKVSLFILAVLVVILNLFLVF